MINVTCLIALHAISSAIPASLPVLDTSWTACLRLTYSFSPRQVTAGAATKALDTATEGLRLGQKRISSGVQPRLTLPQSEADPRARSIEPKIIEHIVESFRTPAPLVEESPGAMAAKKLCTLNVVNMDLATIVRELSTQTKTNLILLAQPDTKVTLRLAKVELRDMIRHLCALTNLSSLNVRDTYVLATEEQLKKGYPLEWMAAQPAEPKNAGPAQEELVTEIYMTNYVDSAQVATALEKVLGTQTLTVIAGPSPVSPSVTSKDTGQATGVAAGIIEREDGSTGRMLILKGPRAVVDSALALAARLDYARDIVEIMVTIHDISNDAIKELGLSWSYSNLTITESNPNGLNIGSFSRAPLSFVASLKALERQDRAKLLASPNISALDGERAFILIGNRINFPVLVGYSQANTPIFDKQEERVGIYLQVAAQVGAEDNITLSLYPQVSAISGFLEANGASYPQISTREAQTTLRVGSGETIVMGGMLKDEELVQIEKVPLLSDLPIIGELFKRRKRTKTSSQVIITITPRILRPKIDEPR